MAILAAGVDEAGLGPILGPLCLGWVVLRLPERGVDPWAALESVVGSEPTHDKERLVVADSKRVFSRNPRGRKRLEATALAFLGARRGAERIPARPAEFLPSVLGPSAECLAAHPWYTSLPGALPLWSEAGWVELRAERLRRALATAQIEIVDLGVRLVPAGELNRAFDATGNKSTAVWGQVGPILRYLWRRSTDHELDLVVDRQGGRAHYGPDLARALGDATVHLIEESDGRSAYRLERHGGGHGGEAVFVEKADRDSFAVALASCLAKYARELSMEAFNGWFAERQVGLKPTAGYATDGRRWLADAEQALAAADLERDLIVRRR
ncbi:hypothetical protein [Engelhardtia mirabilis]|uniref:Uncharacterized protein n=1 Tax=Engelhardtia mirabilis TaxID=2528011 RepID=A0A518BMR5_9BACT|nr:Hypothetical protein Pla133_33630 [Planctomycetes bacterium Pla133]QDV02594.1 Hypothetical protein Pla86_33620 [Planctomycetes bacterium Pla86]